MYFGDLHRRSLLTVRFDGAAIESTAVKQTLTETKRLDTKPKPNQNQSKPSVYSHRTQCHYASVGIIAVVLNSRENTES